MSNDEPKMTVLVVDDVLLNLKVIAAMLRKLGCEVSTSLSGDEALELLESNTYDMIFTDLWMPNMNGKELYQEIKSNPKNRNSIVCAVTADTERGSDFAENDFAAIILKPITMEKLSKVLSSKEQLRDKNSKPLFLP